MNLRNFIERPILSAVISVLIVLIGVVSLFSLPVEQYPDMAPPTVSVMASYPGANAETVVKSVITPLEEQINGVEGMTYMTSSASNTGEANIDIYFKSGTNPDMDAVNVQNRVQAALANLPAEVTKMGVTTEKQQNSELMTFCLYSEDPQFDENFLNNYMNINIIPQLKRIQGVGKVMLFGYNYDMRLWLKPDKMAQYKLIPSDINDALAAQNIEAATGSFGENHDNAYVYTMKYRGRYSKPEEFGNIVIRSLDNGEVLRLKDVADIEMGMEGYNYNNFLDGHPASTAMVQQTAGSNASAVINEIDAELAKVKEELPQGVKLLKVNDTNMFLNASINVVLHTFFEALLLVILVVYVFLQDIRSTLIPAIGIVVSIVGTFAFMSLMGFSINLLTLFALVLAIGTVVDDAIIVVEAVQANFDKGYQSPYLAARDAMSNISKALLTSTIIFMAVFIPVSLMGGTSGAFYRQFGLTMAVSVGISALNAFTLSPALCAMLLKPYMTEDGEAKQNFAARFRRAFNAVFDVLAAKYYKGIMQFIRHKYISFGIIAVAGVLLVILAKSTPTGLVPDEDTGMVYVNLTTKPGTSLQQNAKTLAKLTNMIKDIPGVAHTASTNGYSFLSSGSNAGILFLPLKDWSERGKSESVDSIVNKINALAPEIPEANIMAIAPPMIPGFGMTSGFELNLQDRTGGSIEKFQQVKDDFLAELSKQPEIGMAYSDFSTSYPQYWVDIDAAKCQRAGITPAEILSTVSGYYGGEYISNFNRFSHLYKVTMQATPDSRVTPESLNHIFVRLQNGEMAPASQFMHLTKTFGAQSLNRFNLFTSISVTGTPAEGRSNGEAMAAIERVAKEKLPQGYSYEYGGLSLEESKSSNNFVIVFGLSILIIYLVLAALYESLILPMSILLTVPVGILGCFIMAQLLGIENNIYMQTGIVLLIGLLSKTGILITEYAVEHRQQGHGLVKSGYEAAKERFRPILMTVLAMVLGLLPLMFATGAGANGIRSLASCVVGGMIVGSIALLFLVPALFVIFQWMQEHWMPKRLIDVLRTTKKGACIIIFGLAALSLSSCKTLYGKYERPDVKTSGLVRDVQSATDTLAVKDTTTFANIPWRSVFTDPQLQGLIEKGLANNVNLLNAALNVQMAEAQLKAAKLAFLPSFAFSPQGTISSWDGNAATKVYSLPISASWSADLWGNLLSQKRSAQVALLQTKDYQVSVQTNLIANIANMYYSLLMLDKQLELVNDMEGLTKDTWETMKVLKDTKMGYRATSVQAAESNYYSVLTQKTDIQRQIRETENSLSLLIGDQAHTIARGKLENQSLPANFATGVGIQLLNNRADVHAAEMNLAQCFYGIETARSHFYPALNIAANGTFTNSSGMGIVNPGKWLLSAVGSLTQPIFQNGKLTMGLKVAKIQYEQAYNTWQNTVLKAGSEVSNALVLYNSSDEKGKVEAKQIEVLKQNVEDTRKLMREAGGTYLEVISAQSSLLNVQLSKVADDFYKMQAVVNLYYALGGGAK